MNKIKELFTKDAPWKLLSLCIALFLWFIVINIENPVETRTYNVTIEMLNVETVQDNGFIVSNLDEIMDMKTSIKIKGQRMTLDRISQKRNEISAYVDFSKIEADVDISKPITLSVDLKMPSSITNNYEITSKSPSSISIILDKTQSSIKDIVITTTGSLANGYVMGTIEVNPINVEIIGANKDIETVDHIGATVDVTDASEDIVADAEVFAYDASGAIVDTVQLSQKTVGVKIPIRKSKSVVIEGSTVGLPKSGYVLKDISWQPLTVELVGSEDVLNLISKITLPDVNIKEADSNFSVDFSLREILPETISLKKDVSDTVTVKVIIGKELEKEITISHENIKIIGQLPQGFSASLEENDVVLTVGGDEDLVADLQDGDIECSLDVTGLEAGKYLVELNVELPSNVSIIGDSPKVNVSIVDENSVEDTSSEGEM